MKLKTICFDADDTLWENEQFFRQTQERFARLLADYTSPDHLAQRLLEAERRNLGHYGYGIKGFVLSMIETALDVTEEKVPASVIRSLVEFGQEMLRHPIELLPHVRDTIKALSQEHFLLLVTKGDLLDQERKLAQSGLGDLFDGVEILSEKTPSAYKQVFHRHATQPANAMMVGNSLRSDVVPALEVGSWGVYCPHDLNWELEEAPIPTGHKRFAQIKHLGALPEIIQQIQRTPPHIE